MKRLLIALVALMGATPCFATGDIAMAPGEDWTHERSGTIFPGEIAGLELSRIFDFSDDQYDVAAIYGGIEGGEEVTVYFYRAGLPDVSLWSGPVTQIMLNRQGFEPFDRDQAVIRFVAPQGSEIPSGMRMTYATRGSRIASTGVALMQRGDWLFKIRASSYDRNVVELDTLVDRIMNSFPPAQDAPETPAAYLVEDCSNALDLPDAERAVEDSANTLTAILSSMDVVAGEGSVLPQLARTVWCRDPSSPADYTIFRPNGRSDAYVMAFLDAGVVLSVGHWDGLLGDLASRIENNPIPVVFRTSTENAYYALFLTTPTPQQAMAALDAGRALGTYDREPNSRINIVAPMSTEAPRSTE